MACVRILPLVRRMESSPIKFTTNFSIPCCLRPSRTTESSQAAEFAEALSTPLAQTTGTLRKDLLNKDDRSAKRASNSNSINVYFAKYGAAGKKNNRYKLYNDFKVSK